MHFFLDVKLQSFEFIENKILVINQNQQKRSRIQRRDCKIQRWIVKYYTAKSVGRARQGFVQGDVK